MEWSLFINYIHACFVSLFFFFFFAKAEKRHLVQAVQKVKDKQKNICKLHRIYKPKSWSSRMYSSMMMRRRRLQLILKAPDSYATSRNKEGTKTTHTDTGYWILACTCRTHQHIVHISLCRKGGTFRARRDYSIACTPSQYVHIYPRYGLEKGVFSHVWYQEAKS